jgi:hypothetical protein
MYSVYLLIYHFRSYVPLHLKICLPNEMSCSRSRDERCVRACNYNRPTNRRKLADKADRRSCGP